VKATKTGRNRHHDLAHGGDIPADRGIRDIARLERDAFLARSRLDRAAASITHWAASGLALVAHTAWFGLWIVLNSGLSPITPFDPYPFSLLTMIVSLEAIFLTLFVLITQNRMSHEADRRAELDLQVNLLAEKESTMVLRILHDISSHLGVETRASKDLKELLKETRIEELAKKLEKALPGE
jgi:uncharacterized membrane protein